ncbi:MAG: phage portal protein [Lachnospiraceae bacterium]|nr:phage portal protein [Lachnospiraceae bacterium]
MAELLGIARLRQRLAQKAPRVGLRYSFYEQKNIFRSFNLVIPARWNALAVSMGWATKAVDALADRLVFRAFDRDFYGMADVFRMNSEDVLTDSSILAALISGCSFVYISEGENGEPRLQVLDGANATGVIDPITRMLTEGYAVLERDPQTFQPSVEAYFTADETVILRGQEETHYPNPAPYPLLVPVVHRPDARRPFGHSRISRACMAIQDAAARDLQRAEVSSEFYSFPQKYATGLSPEAEFDNFRASISSFLSFTTDEDGSHPVLGQFQQQSMTPFVDILRMYAGLFAGETGLTLDDLGFPSVNPSSAEAIKASHESLRVAVRKAQRDFETAFLNVGYLAACVRDGKPYARNQVYGTKVRWMPAFELDMSALGMAGDAVLKINQAVPGYLDADALYELTGIEE